MDHQLKMFVPSEFSQTYYEWQLLYQRDGMEEERKKNEARDVSIRQQRIGDVQR